MKSTKKFLSILLSLVMIISIIPLSTITAGAEETATSGTCGENVTWNFDEETGTLTISGEGEMSVFGGSTSIPWRNYDEAIKNIIIENGVKTISDYAFYHHKNLTNVTIPHSITSIGSLSFWNCSNLETIIIPDSVTFIGVSAFDDTAYYNDVNNWENGLLYIDDCLIAVDENIYGTCEIGTETRIISYGAFVQCNITNFKVDNDNPYFSSNEDGVLFNKDKTVLIQYPMSNIKTEYIIPYGVTEIGDGAFLSCTNLTNIEIPDTTTRIGLMAFYGCTSLVSTTIGDNVISIEEAAFYGCTSLASVVIPNSVITIETSAFFACTSLKDVIIGDGVKTIGFMAFYHCESLENLKIGNSVEFIMRDAFEGCYSLTNVVLPDSIVTLGQGVFCGCIKLKEINIPDSVTSIGPYIFQDCYSLEKIKLSKNITEIGDYAFIWCENLVSIELPKSITSIGYGAFAGCTNLKDVYYGGTEEEWNNMKVDIANTPLLNATIHYNYHEHIYESVVTAPTCTAQGYTTYTCACGDSYVDNYVNATGHNYTSTVTAPTCTAQGYTTYTCECGDTYVDNYVNATGHADNDGDGYCDACDELLDPTVECDCNCHKSGIKKFFFKFALFFQKIFGTNKICSCGTAHY